MTFMKLSITKLLDKINSGSEFTLNRREFYIQGSVHRYSILIRSNKMQEMQVFITEKLLYMFRTSIDPIIRSTSNCNYILWYMSYCKYKSFELEV